MGSFGHNFGTRKARKPIKGSKDSYSLESKQTLNHNIGSLSGRWRHERKTKESKTYPAENPKLKSQVFFQSKLQDFTSVSRLWI